MCRPGHLLLEDLVADNTRRDPLQTPAFLVADGHRLRAATAGTVAICNLRPKADRFQVVHLGNITTNSLFAVPPGVRATLPLRAGRSSLGGGGSGGRCRLLRFWERQVVGVKALRFGSMKFTAEFFEIPLETEDAFLGSFEAYAKLPDLLVPRLDLLVLRRDFSIAGSEECS